MIYSW